MTVQSGLCANLVMCMKSKRSKATDIPKPVKDCVWERDNHACVLCGSIEAMPNAHYISRANSGLGIEQNIVTLCLGCHFDLDMSTNRKELLQRVREYLEIHYPGFPDEDRRYIKWH